MARQIVDIENLTDYERGITANVGLTTGGTGINVVPQHCSAELDMRVPDAATADEVVGKILGLKTYDPDVRMEITGGINRPPYEMDEGIQKLFDHAQSGCSEIGFDLQGLKTRTENRRV